MTRLADLMIRNIVGVAPEDTLAEAAQLMTDQSVGSAVVIDHGRLIGIVTERDLLRAAAGRVHPSDGRVREWMTVDPIVASEDASPAEAARTMLENGFRHLPVVDQGRTVGIVSLRDVMRWSASVELPSGELGPDAS